jgi:hypothetical protein
MAEACASDSSQDAGNGDSRSHVLSGLCRADFNCVAFQMTMFNDPGKPPFVSPEYT